MSVAVTSSATKESHELLSRLPQNKDDKFPGLSTVYVLLVFPQYPFKLQIAVEAVLTSPATGFVTQGGGKHEAMVNCTAEEFEESPLAVHVVTLL